MPKAVQFDHYGGVDVLQVVEVPRPTPNSGEVVVRVKAAAINPGEAKIRQGALDHLWPATFPSGQGSDLAGVVEVIGDGVDSVSPGDEVIGFTHRRASHAEFVVVEAANLTRKPAALPWEVAGSLFVAGTTAFAAVRAVELRRGDTVVVSGAAGGVGSLVTQLAVLSGTRVIGLASEANHQWLRDHGAIPVDYEDGFEDRIGDAAVAAGGGGGLIDAWIDTVGGDYVELALDYGVRPERINSIVRFDAPELYGVQSVGNAAGASAEVVRELAQLAIDGRLEVPIARTYPLAEVRDAFAELEGGYVRGKIVLIP